LWLKRDEFPKLEIHRVENGSLLLQPDDPYIVAIAPDQKAAGGKVPVLDLNDIEAIVDLLLERAVPPPADGCRPSVMAQFPTIALLSGRSCRSTTWSVSFMSALHRLQRPKTSHCAPHPAACWRTTSKHPSTHRSTFGGRRLRRTSSDQPKGDTKLRITGRLTAGSATQPVEKARPSASSPAHRQPAGTDTVFMQEDVRVEGESLIAPPGLKSGANRRLAGEDARKDRSLPADDARRARWAPAAAGTSSSRACASHCADRR
jgi:hypothetical protein